MKNVGLLISELNSGGAERVVSRLSTILSKEYNVYLILFEDTYINYNYSGKLINMNIPAQKGASKIKLFITRTNKLKKIKKKLELDCCISFLDSPNMTNILSRNSKCKTIISIRNYSELENSSSLLGKITNGLYRLLYSKADYIVPVSKAIEDLYISHYGIDEKKIVTIYNPFDTDELQSLMIQKPEINLDKLAGKFVFVTVGRQMYQKGCWHLIKAFSQVAKKYSDTVLVMIGTIDSKVERLIDELNLHENVILTGRLNNPFSIIHKSDVYVLSSLFEGFPNAMVEAMACGIPVIASDCKSGPREILAPGTDINHSCADIEYAEYGILSRPLELDENWDAQTVTTSELILAKAMLTLAENSNLRKMYADKATERSKTFNYDNCKSQFIELIEK